MVTIKIILPFCLFYFTIFDLNRAKLRNSLKSKSNNVPKSVMENENILIKFYPKNYAILSKTMR